MSRRDTLTIQRKLRGLGYAIAADGRWGPETDRAFNDYLASRSASAEPAPEPEPLPMTLEAIEPKAWWRSRTLIGAGVVVLTSIARLVLPEWEVDTHALTDAVLDGLALAGGVLAWWGRLRASQPIRRRVRAGGADPDGLRRQRLPSNRYGPAADSSPADRARDGDEFWAGNPGPFLDD